MQARKLTSVQKIQYTQRVYIVFVGTLHTGDIIHTINGWKARGSDIDTVANHMVCVVCVCACVCVRVCVCVSVYMHWYLLHVYTSLCCTSVCT